jgi:hypothetical protein
MSRYDGISTEDLKTGVTAMSEIAKQYSTDHWQTGQDQMHNEIDQVLTEIDDRK